MRGPLPARPCPAIAWRAPSGKRLAERADQTKPPPLDAGFSCCRCVAVSPVVFPGCPPGTARLYIAVSEGRTGGGMGKSPSRPPRGQFQDANFLRAASCTER